MKAAVGRLLNQLEVWETLTFDDGIYHTELCGEPLRFHVDNRKQLNRAKHGLREESVMEWLFQDIDSETVFWDVGAYHGHYSVVAASKGAEVFSFEPNSDDLVRAEQNANLNELKIWPKNAALSDESTVLQISGDVASEQQIGKTGDSVVTTWVGDDVTPNPDVVKIDVEGHEKQVLEGMEETLQQVERIVIEVHEGVSSNVIAEMLVDAGLEMEMVRTTRSQTYIGGSR